MDIRVDSIATLNGIGRSVEPFAFFFFPFDGIYRDTGERRDEISKKDDVSPPAFVYQALG